MAEEKQTSLKPLTIYFYHTRLTRESYEEWKEYKFPIFEQMTAWGRTKRIVRNFLNCVGVMNDAGYNIK